MIHSNLKRLNPIPSPQGIRSIECKLQDERLAGLKHDVGTRDTWRETYAVDVMPHLAGYARTIDSNVSRAFLVRRGQNVGLLYRNHASDTTLLLEMNYF